MNRKQTTTAVPHGLSRRQLWQWTAGGYFGLSLPRLLQAQAGSGQNSTAGASRIEACIFVFFYGGPSHLDSFDPKPLAPAEIRGQFSTIPTAVPNIRLSEHLPLLARSMPKIALVRSMNHRMRAHDSACAESLTGRTPFGGDRETFPDNPQTYPSHGATVSYLWRDRHLPVCHAALPFVMNNVIRNPGQTPGFLGPAYTPFLITGDPATLTYGADTLQLPPGQTQAMMDQRQELLGQLENAGPLEAAGNVSNLQQHYDRAFDLIRSEPVRRALDLSQEAPSVRERYGLGLLGSPSANVPPGDNGAHLAPGRSLRGQNLLVARRLVEAGVPFVNVYDYKQQGQNWDAHSDGFNQHKDFLLPQADRALSALIDDLDDRGLLETTLVVATGEFGRTPRINNTGGRDHWPDCYTTLLAGGGIRGGTVFGASDRNGAYPDADPVTPADLAATIFWRFGIDPETEIQDAIGRPFRVAEGRPIQNLFTLS